VRQDLLVGTRGTQAQKQQAKAKAQAQALAAKRSAAVGMAIQQCCAALESCTGAAELLVQEVAQGYFLNLLVLFLAMVGRLSALLRHVGTLAFGLHQALEGRIGEIEAGQEGEKTRGARSRLLTRKFAHALGLDVPSLEEGTTAEEASVKRQPKAGQDDDDDLGVSLGAAAAVVSFTFPISAAPVLSVRTKLIPASTTAGVTNAAATSTTRKSAVASRAMLASEYSSSSEENEEEDDEEGVPAKQQQQQRQQQQPQPSPPALPTAEELKQKEEDESSAAAIRFVIDRKPDINPAGSGSSSSGCGKPAKSERQQPPPPKPVHVALTTASGGAAKKKKVNKDKQKDKREASAGSLLDEIDDIFNAAGAKKAKRRKMDKYCDAKKK